MQLSKQGGGNSPGLAPDDAGLGDIASRVEALPAATVQRIMGNAEVHPESLSGGLRSKGWGFSRVPASDLSFPGEFLEGLRCDRWFHCPDSLDGMSEGYGVVKQVERLRGSTVSRLPSATQAAAIGPLHAALKQESKDAWATEAVMKGIGLAKDGQYSKARAFYDQALDLNPRNVDALVAKGASYANQSRLAEAVTYFERAIAIEPEHSNAAGYLAATRKKLEAQGGASTSAVQQVLSRQDSAKGKHEDKKAFEAELQEAFAAVRKRSKKERKSGVKDKSHSKDKKRRRN